MVESRLARPVLSEVELKGASGVPLLFSLFVNRVHNDACRLDDSDRVMIAGREQLAIANLIDCEKVDQG